MTGPTSTINERERKVLEVLAEEYHPDEWGAYGFDSLSALTGLDRRIVRRACRSLARKGLAVYERTLWNDDGPAGAGYRATENGAAFITPCDICGKRASYDYPVNAEGKATWKGDDVRRVRECADHYEKSAAAGTNATLAI